MKQLAPSIDFRGFGRKLNFSNFYDGVAADEDIGRALDEAPAAGRMIDAMGYVNYYLLTTFIALPGVFLFWYMIRSGLADLSIGSAGKEEK